MTDDEIMAAHFGARLMQEIPMASWVKGYANLKSVLVHAKLLPPGEGLFTTPCVEVSAYLHFANDRQAAFSALCSVITLREHMDDLGFPVSFLLGSWGKKLAMGEYFPVEVREESFQPRGVWDG